jgi:hypothetical protein
MSNYVLESVAIPIIEAALADMIAKKVHPTPKLMQVLNVVEGYIEQIKAMNVAAPTPAPVAETVTTK